MFACFTSEQGSATHLDIMAVDPAAKPGRPERGEATGMRALYTYIRQRYRDRVSNKTCDGIVTAASHVSWRCRLESLA